MIKNDTCTELSKIPLGHNSHNGAVYSKVNFKDEICNTDVRWSSHASIPIANTVCFESPKLNPNNFIVEVRGLSNTFDYTQYIL